MKGDPADWMRRYFDAHVYSSGWAACSFLLRLPKSALDAAAAAAATATAAARHTAGRGSVFSMRAVGGHRILDWARLCSCELDDDEEPPVPPVPAGLRQLSPAQEALAEFLVLDPDLLEVAASGSVDLPTNRETARLAKEWAASLPVAALRAL